MSVSHSKHVVVWYEFDDDVFASVRIECKRSGGYEFTLWRIDTTRIREVRCPFCGAVLRLRPVRAVVIESEEEE